MEGHCSTGQSPQWAVVPMEEEDEEEEEEEEEGGGGGRGGGGEEKQEEEQEGEESFNRFLVALYSVPFDVYDISRYALSRMC